jgi:high-affinity nickel permease
LLPILHGGGKNADSSSTIRNPLRFFLPFGFMAAMTLCDTEIGVAMMKMYRSAAVNTRRRIGSNLVITGVSAVSAIFISVITIAGVLHAMLGLTDPVTTWLRRARLPTYQDHGALPEEKHIVASLERNESDVETAEKHTI